MSRRRFTGGFAQRDCHACGRNHRFTGGGCVTVAVFEAVRDFAAAHGRTWRSKLRELWDSGADEGPLREARNAIGPTRIAKVRPERVRVSTEAERVERARRASGERGGAS